MIRYHTMLAILCQIVMCTCLFIAGCGRTGNQPVDLSDYYLPAGEIGSQGTVYTYRNVNDTSAAPEVWMHRSIGEGRIESINYNPAGEMVQKQHERIVNNGIITDSLTLYGRDSMGVEQAIEVKVLSPHRFPFQPGDTSTVWLSKMEWWQPADSLHVVLERRRVFQAYTTWKSGNKSLLAVRFRTADTFETELDGWTSSSWTGEEIYAKGIGLVYYKREVSKDFVLEFALERE